MAGGAGNLNGDCSRRCPLHTRRSPITIAGCARCGMGIDPHSRSPLSEKVRPDGRVRGPERHRGTWWSRVEQRELLPGVDFVEDPQDGADDDFEFIPASDEEGESIPVRLFLTPYELTPTYRNINNKFNVKYYLNLVLVDEEDRRYFKQQEITMYRLLETPQAS